MQHVQESVSAFTQMLKAKKDPEKVIEFQSGIIASLIAAMVTGDRTVQSTLLEAMGINHKKE